MPGAGGRAAAAAERAAVAAAAALLLLLVAATTTQAARLPQAEKNAHVMMYYTYVGIGISFPLAPAFQFFCCV